MGVYIYMFIHVYTCLYMFIPPIKVVMPGGWFYGIVLPTLVRFKPQEFWDFIWSKSHGDFIKTDRDKKPTEKSIYPLVICNVTNWKITIFNGKTHYFYGHFQ